MGEIPSSYRFIFGMRKLEWLGYNLVGTIYVNQRDRHTDSHVKVLDTLHATATGLDGVPACFLRLGAPVFAMPVAQLLHLSIS